MNENGFSLRAKTFKKIWNWKWDDWLTPSPNLYTCRDARAYKNLLLSLGLHDAILCNAIQCNSCNMTKNHLWLQEAIFMREKTIMSSASHTIMMIHFFQKAIGWFCDVAKVLCKFWNNIYSWIKSRPFMFSPLWMSRQMTNEKVI